MLKRLWLEEEGANMIEYGLLAALISVVVIATLTAIGNNLKTKFQEVNAAVD